MAPFAKILNNGFEMPIVGLGTWRSPPSVITNVIKDAIEMGYRHFDCAYIYGNEAEIGAGLDEQIHSGVVKREELFITSKLWNTFHKSDNVRAACEISLNRLKLDYLDLYLIHWPMGFKEGDEVYPKDFDGNIVFSEDTLLDTWKAMEALVEQKLCRSIGLSNFNLNQMKNILENCKIKPQVLQVECHPYLQQEELINFCSDNNIIFTAYSSLGSAHSPYAKPGDYPLLQNPVVQKIAKNNKCTTAQVLLRFQIQRGNVVIPRSVDKEHLKSNLEVLNMGISESDMEELKALEMGESGRIVRMELGQTHRDYPFAVLQEEKSEMYS